MKSNLDSLNEFLSKLDDNMTIKELKDILSKKQSNEATESKSYQQNDSISDVTSADNCVFWGSCFGC